MRQRLLDALPADALTTRTLPDGRELPCAAPRDEDQWRAILDVARDVSAVLLPTGGGSRLDAVPERVDLLVSTAGTTGVVAYEPGDGTLTARAGSRMAELAETVRAGGHHLTPDVARPEAATLGGVLSSGASGFDRLRYGPTRHNVLGMRVLLADGRVTKSGGALVKNVTGYDLHRFYCGARGTLCVVLEASLRLAPVPRRRLLARHAFPGRDEALSAAHGILAEPVRPEALHLRGSELSVFLGGRVEVVTWELERVLAYVPGAELVEDAEAEAAWQRARDGEAPGGLALELELRPSRLVGALARVSDLAAERGLVPRISAHPGLATGTVRFDGAAQGRAFELGLRTFAEKLRGELSGTEVVQRWRGLPPGLRASVPALTPAPPAPALQRALAQALDPEGRFARGGPHASA